MREVTLFTSVERNLGTLIKKGVDWNGQVSEGETLQKVVLCQRSPFYLSDEMSWFNVRFTKQRSEIFVDPDDNELGMVIKKGEELSLEELEKVLGHETKFTYGLYVKGVDANEIEVIELVNSNCLL